MDIQSESSDSKALSAEYPAHYREFQIRNWSPVDLVITYPNGEQHAAPAMSGLREREACAEIQFRQADGARVEYTNLGVQEKPIEYTRTIIPFDLYRNSPYRVAEYGVILSTADMSIVAKEMAVAREANPLSYETRNDEEIVDPRFVFQVVDPRNQWDALFVNIFGKTIIVRAGHWINELVGVDDTSTLDGPKLMCYLRYPYDYYQHTRPVETVFSVSLDNLDNEEPIVLPEGDTICVASSMESLQRVLVKKSTGHRGRVAANALSSKMVTKEVYESAQKVYEKEIEKVKAECKAKIETVSVGKDNEISKLKAEIVKLTGEKESLTSQVRHWEALNAAQTKVGTSSAEVAEAIAKARKETYEASRKDIDNMWNMLKLGGAVAASVVSFSIAAYVKSRK